MIERLYSNLRKYVIDNYFLIAALAAFAIMLNLPILGRLNDLFFYSMVFCALYKVLRTISKIDCFLLLFGSSLILISGLINYEKELWQRGCNELLLLSFFFIGEHNHKNDWNIIYKNILPFIIVGIASLYLYLVSPGWYISFKMEQWDDNASRLLEMSRLSGFWTYPYWISYGCPIFCLFTYCKSYYSGYIRTQDIFFVLFLILLTMLTQQRAPLLFMSIITVIFVFSGLFSGNKLGGKSGYLKFLALLFLVINVAINMMNADMLEHFIGKFAFLFSQENLLRDRADVFIDFKSKDITVFGDGIGFYSHVAYAMGKLAITDQQYMKILYETGYWGACGYIMIFATCIYKALKNYKENLFELGLIMFYLLSMTGANSLTMSIYHVPILWFFCGRLFNEEWNRVKVSSLIEINSNRNEQ